MRVFSATLKQLFVCEVVLRSFMASTEWDCCTIGR